MQAQRFRRTDAEAAAYRVFRISVGAGLALYIGMLVLVIATGEGWNMFVGPIGARGAAWMGAFALMAVVLLA